MNAEHILDAVGLLPDDLIREAEEYRRPRRDYSDWIGLAASLAVVLVLGYGLFQLGNLGMGGGAAPENQVSGGAASAPAGSSGWQAGLPGESANGGDGAEPGSPGGGDYSVNTAPQGPPPAGDGTEDLLSAVRADGAVYRSTGEIVQLSPDESEVRYGLSWVQESGEERFDPGCRWLPLEDGTVAVFRDVQDQGWLIFAPAEE